MHKILGADDDKFVRHVVYSRCHSVYYYNDCVETKANNQKESKRCCHVAYPNHPHMARRKPCDNILLKKVRSKCGYSLQPIKVYPYHSLKSSISQLIKKPGFLESCEKWRGRVQNVPDSYYGDIL